MPLKTSQPAPDAEVIALNCLGFLAEDGDRLGRFLAISGVSPQALRAQAREPSFLAGVLDYLLADEKLLLAFSEAQGLLPETVIAARLRLPGAASC
ncbi:MAG: DUF3572 domain-containing protein [Rhizobiales bacterium]|nr:DUF3572 domain-containing protein [Hyphomicrobiales bacterium]